ncbi:hypothetical protein ACFWGD_10905 [Corynebacterium sp. NPDC060344]|uniref:hypothetical protein n=1 Tax=Corynebacterium sp. NPDC060344 TaxID=3347101 RepID=UPI003646C599
MSRWSGRALLAAVLAGGLALGGCTLPGGSGDGSANGADGTNGAAETTDDGRPNPTSPASAGPGNGEGPGDGPGDGSTTPGTDGLSEELSAEIDDILADWGGEAGLAVVAPGVTGHGPQLAGNFLTGVAWSTSKVPIAIASVRLHGGADANVTAAISASDNAAAEAMWAGLGDPATAATAADYVLRDGGDVMTDINAERIRPEFTAFGQTQWALPDQARFAAGLTCISGAAPVVEAMGNIAADQRYGLGTIPGVRFKGGWGPDESGMYLVRQFGSIPVDGGELGVAIAARPTDGTYESGQAMLTEIAAALQRHMPAGGSC